jgi:hypothetical protein
MKAQPAEPAATIIRKLGGEEKVSRATGTKRVAPYRWQYSKEKGGTNGLIPQRHHPRLLAFAKQIGVPLSSDEFLPPSLSAPSTPSAGSTSDHESAASLDPTSETSKSPPLVGGGVDRAALQSG